MRFRIPGTTVTARIVEAVETTDPQYDVFDVGNDLGLAFGMPNFATELAGGYTPHDSNYLVELYASFQVTDNIQITPSVFWLSRPLGHYTANLYGDQDQSRDSSLGVFGGLIQSVFRF